MWFAGLKALISSHQGGRPKIDGWRDGGLYFEVNDTPFTIPLIIVNVVLSK